MSVVTQSNISQPWLFQRLRWTVARNAGSLVVGNSRARLIMIVVSSLIVAGTVFAAGLEGFLFLRHTEIPFNSREQVTVSRDLLATARETIVVDHAVGELQETLQKNALPLVVRDNLGIELNTL